MTKTYTFSQPIWLYSGESAWHFITVPTELAEEIDHYFEHVKKGWGSLRVLVTIGQTSWQTSIFPDKKSNSYLLPVKAEVRKAESLQVGDTVELSLEIRSEQ